ncbi:MAG TPA: hypothetical protein VHN14_00955 [Kofleriaceae bacterium]|jgi:hypothetical protein|nr:hypothetical protein [Kofleriaceae bacterium]
MRASSIKKKLKNHPIRGRWSTINGAVQCALAVPEVYDEEKLATLIGLLDQKLDEELVCVYCSEAAATWDHVFNNVQDGRFSGYGNRIFNLVPACRTCNETKRGLHWRDFVKVRAGSNAKDVLRRLAGVEARNDAERHSWSMISERYPELAAKYDSAQRELKAKIDELDELARQIRDAIKRDLPAVAGRK